MPDQSSEKDLRLAVLIDADNASRTAMKDVMAEVAVYGTPTIKRIYGDWTSPNMNSWKSILLETAITPIQQYSYTTGKNSTDSAMIIDAMDILYTGHCDGFVLVSSDSDFTRLASRLRESQKYVLGMGESKTPRSFISACNKFLYLDVLLEEAENEADTETTDAAKPAIIDDTPPVISPATEEPVKSEKTSGKNFRTIRQALVKITEENSDDNGWIFSGTLGNLLNKQFSDFDVRNFGFKKFVPFIESLDMFEVNTITDDKNKTVKHNYFKLKPVHRHHYTHSSRSRKRQSKV